MKHLKKFLALACVLALTLSLTGCGPVARLISNVASLAVEDSGDYDDDDDYDGGVTESDSDDVIEDDSEDDTEEPESDAVLPADDVVNGDTQTIGSYEVGYVDVPADFVTFYNDVYLGPGTIQYSDMTGSTIVTMQYFDGTYSSAESCATGMYMQFAGDSEVDQSTLTSASVTIGGVNAYQVYCYYPAYETYVVTWSFESPYDDYIHYIAVEFDYEDYYVFEMVEDTYRFTY